MILEESMLSPSEVLGDSKQKKEKADGSASVTPELNNMYRLHGNVPQKVRQEVYKKFCKAKNGILVLSTCSSKLFSLSLAHEDILFYFFSPVLYGCCG